MSDDKMKKIAEDYKKKLVDAMRVQEAQDGKTDATIEAALAAQDKFEKLSAKFNGVSGHGIGRDDRGSFLQVFMLHTPSAVEESKLPKDIDGVRVKYSVIGGVRPF